MASNNRDTEDTMTPSSSPITVSDTLDSYPTDPNSHIGSASNSFQNESLLGGGNESNNGSDGEFGFSRPEFRLIRLAGTVQYYERHVFLCYKNPSVWPPRIEAAEFDRLPRLLAAALLARKGDMKKETRLTICEGHDGTETSNGDVLIFPDMIRYRRLTHFDVDTFVEEVLVKDGEWLPGTPETLKGSYVFVCSHASRDRRCGVCGPPLVSRFRREIELHGLQGKVSISPCSHIGGHKYAGNVIIFGPNINGEVTGHWYGFVNPEDVPALVEHHIGKGETADWIWRGQMGLSEEEQKKSLEQRLQVSGEINAEKSTKELTQRQMNEVNTATCGSQLDLIGCCQGEGNSYCQNSALPENIDTQDADERAVKVTPEKKNSKKLITQVNGGKGAFACRVCAMPTWFESWEREDTFAALAVACAAVSVFVAYSCYKQLG